MRLRLHRRATEARLFWLQSEGKLNELWLVPGTMMRELAENYPTQLVNGPSDSQGVDIYREHHVTEQELTLLLLRYPELLEHYVLIR